MPPQLNVQFDFTKKHDKAHTYTTWKKKWSGAKKKKRIKKKNLPALWLGYGETMYRKQTRKNANGTA